jgi:DNA polymerase-3 subunit gamma/tau
LSLLDQAIALADGPIGEGLVRDMLGLADRTQLFDLFDRLMQGDAAGVLALVATLYGAGADPASLVQDLLELTHWLTRLKVAPQAADQTTVPEAERVRGKAMAERLGMAQLSRSWQMLLKGLSEVQQAPAALQALEMLMVRLTYAAELPTPASLVETMVAARPPAAASRPAGEPAGGGAAPRIAPAAAVAVAPPTTAEPPPGNGPRAALALRGEVAPPPLERALAEPATFADLVALFAERREAILHAHLFSNVHLVHFEPGRVELRPNDQAPVNLASRIGTLLGEWTGRRWVVAIASEPGQPTLSEQQLAAEDDRRQKAAGHPLVKAVLAGFPGATIEAVRDLAAPPPAESTSAEDTP